MQQWTAEGGNVSGAASWGTAPADMMEGVCFPAEQKTMFPFLKVLHQWVTTLVFFPESWSHFLRSWHQFPRGMLIFLSIHPPLIYLLIYLSVHHLSIHPFIHLTACLPVYLLNLFVFVHLSICLFTCPFIFLYIYPSLHPPIHQFFSPHTHPSTNYLALFRPFMHHPSNHYPPTYLSVHPNIHPSSIHSSIHPHIHPCIDTYIHLSTVHLSFHSSIHLSFHISTLPFNNLGWVSGSQKIFFPLKHTATQKAQELLMWVKVGDQIRRGSEIKSREGLFQRTFFEISSQT